MRGSHGAFTAKTPMVDCAGMDVQGYVARGSFCGIRALAVHEISES